MTSPRLWFCCFAGVLLYAYFIYPVLIALLARWGRSRTAGHCDIGLPRSVSIVVAAHNEAAAVPRRLAELAQQVADAEVPGEVILVSDGSTDETVRMARGQGGANIRVLELSRKVGKARALNAGCAAARGDVTVFADMRQRWEGGTLRRLLEPFRDPEVGAVSGDLVVERADGPLAGVGLYWRYEKWLRLQEGSFHSQVGVTGAISAVRRELYSPIPAGTILDDVYWPLRVTMAGRRVVPAPGARAFDRLPDRARDEMARKVRTLTGNFQLLQRLPGALVPWRNPICFQFISHKVMRLLAPWALLGMLAISAWHVDPWFRILFWGQVAGYLTGLLGLWKAAARRVPLATTAASFLVLNCAAWVAFWMWISRREGRTWRKVSYQVSPAGYPGN